MGTGFLYSHPELVEGLPAPIGGGRLALNEYVETQHRATEQSRQTSRLRMLEIDYDSSGPKPIIF